MGPPETRRGFDPALWHTLSSETVLAHLQSTPTGLTGAEAAQRLAEQGPNELQATHSISPWTILFEQFKNVLIVILLVATALSAFLGHGIEAIAIAVIVLFACLLGFVQEYRAERATEALRQMAAPTATALRDREEVEIPARALVPGDVVLLRAGDKIPADVRLIESVNLQIEEAALTGESVPVDKHATPLTNDELALGDRKNMAYAGTAATY
ncbi:MAG: HAD-IC family P-type ATPase, partial [Kofleriaceae bacterium]|nr:HAD-IC family P-type ATPase [Candidatus Methylomirabilis lanthanidiphila]